MSFQDTQEYWEDAKGNHVRLTNISEVDQIKDETARRLVEGAKGIQQAMAAFKRTAFDEMLAAKELIFEQYGATVGGKGGNFSIKSFDGKVEVKVQVSKQISLGPEFQAAKSLIDECIEDWSDGANDNLRTLVEDAFQVNTEGRIDTARVLSLRKLKMKNSQGEPDERWGRAMDAIADAVHEDGTKTYIRFYDRTNATDGGAVTLDFAKL
jgi:hypothetical protein